MNFTNESASPEMIEKFVQNNLYMVRDCKIYKQDYKHCKSIRARFHQYFTTGDFADCEDRYIKWKNCDACELGNTEACAKIIALEYKLKQERMKNHLKNDVWEKRSEPPADWNKPLPEWLSERPTYFFPKDEGKTCSIM